MAESLIFDPHRSFKKGKNFHRQGAQGQPLTCPADREDLDRDRVNNFVFEKFSGHIT